MRAALPPRLTDNEQRVLNAILEHQRREGTTPSTREIQQALGYGSQTSVMQYRRSLMRKGHLKTVPGQARTAVVRTKSASGRPEGRATWINVPIRGEITAGMAVDAPAHEGGVLPVNAAQMGLGPGSRPFALRVRGDSMTGACIQSGDYVILDAAREPVSGNVVAALIDGETTLKRYVRCGDGHFLKAENPLYPNLIPLRELEVQGVMVGLVRGSGVE